MLKQIFVLTLLITFSLAYSDVSHDKGQYTEEEYQECLDDCKSKTRRQQNSDDDTVFQITCEEKCENQLEDDDRSTPRIIIGIILVLIIISLIICAFCFFLPSIKKWCANRSEYNRRKPVEGKITEEQFDKYVSDFQKIFTEGERNNWTFFYEFQNSEIQMQWFSLELNRKSPFQASLLMKGQDIKGVWVGEGSFVYAITGPTAWWFKKYEGMEYLEDESLIFELQRETSSHYEGRWYFQGSQFVENRSGKCILKTFLSSSSSALNDVISMPESDEIHF